MPDYDIEKAFKKIENDLIASMIRNLDRHRAEENELGINWEQWQVKQLEALEVYKRKNAKKYSKEFKNINNRIPSLLSMQREVGNSSQENAILKAIKAGVDLKKTASGATGEFLRMNDRKMNALINATTADMQKAEYAMLRMTNDQYRKVIFNAQIFANSGATTYAKAVDMATKDFLRAGIQCVEYKNGARHTLADYADMSIRTAGKRAYLTGEGEKRNEWGISTVIMNKRGNPCPRCLPFVGKVLIDDIWSGGTSKDGKHPLMSTAMHAGLYHPRCKDSHTTYFPELDEPDDKFTKQELSDVEENYRVEQKQLYAKQQTEKYSRLAKYSLDPDNKRTYEARANEWEDAYKEYNGPGIHGYTEPPISKELDSCQSIDDIEVYCKKKYGVSVDNDVKELNPIPVKHVFSEFETVMDDFHVIKDSFSGLNTHHKGKASLSPIGELCFNPEWYKVDNIKHLSGSGYHEAGHLMELALIKKYNPNAGINEILNMLNDCTYAKRVLNKAYAKISTNKTLDELRGNISAYSLLSEAETVAEAIKDFYLHGSGMKLLSRQIVKVMKGELL